MMSSSFYSVFCGLPLALCQMQLTSKVGLHLRGQGILLLAQALTRSASMHMQVSFGGELECQAESQWVALACRASFPTLFLWR